MVGTFPKNEKNMQFWGKFPPLFLLIPIIMLNFAALKGNNYG